MIHCDYCKDIILIRFAPRCICECHSANAVMQGKELEK